MSDTSDDDIHFTTEPKGELYEPEFTDAELRQMETAEERERRRGR